ncbi:hypothetical protein BH10ACT2_BH10ACT2_10600 [soil metagenome]
MKSERRGRGWRSRWAAVGAVVAVSFGAGGFYIGHATPPVAESSTFVAITPVRVLDTRSNLGLTGVFTSPTSRDLVVTGSIATADGIQIVVPEGATAVSMNVTVVSPSANGFLAVRPADATGAPSTSNLNFIVGQVIPNAVTVKVPTSSGDAGKIEITYSAGGTTGPTTNVLVDIVGYFQATDPAPVDGDPCTAGALDGTIINGYNSNGDTTIKCFRGLVSTFAGSTYGFADGDLARFAYPDGVAVDAAGNVYVADTDNHRIRKITPAGIVTTLAGSTNGFTDGIGAAAQFSSPHGVAVDATGNVYVADTDNQRIRKITAAGDVTTLAGNGNADWVDDNGTSAQFDHPRGIAVDTAGNVYVGDSANNRIRKITPGGDVSTLAGSTQGWVDGNGATAQLSFPWGVAVDAAGNVYVADRGNNRIRKITPGGDVTTLAGQTLGGWVDDTGAAAMFNHPQGVAVDTAGNVYVADTDNHRIRKITPVGVVTTLAGSTLGYLDGQGTAAQFAYPSGVALDAAGNVYVGDVSNERIRQIN